MQCIAVKNQIDSKNNELMSAKNVDHPATLADLEEKLAQVPASLLFFSSVFSSFLFLPFLRLLSPLSSFVYVYRIDGG